MRGPTLTLAKKNVASYLNKMRQESFKYDPYGGIIRIRYETGGLCGSELVRFRALPLRHMPPRPIKISDVIRKYLSAVIILQKTLFDVNEF